MRALALLASLLATACAVAPPASTPAFQDARFAPASQRIDARSVLALSDSMRRFIHVEIADDIARKGPQQALFDAIYGRKLKLEYDAAVTRNAAEAFDARAGNCLSLVIMTAALAKEAGLEVRYQRVISDDAWSRAGDTYFASGHVNLTLARKFRDPRVRYDEQQMLTVDFIPPAPNTFPMTVQLSEGTVIAMFMNNRAAEALAADRIDDAYWWARAAIVQDPAYLSAYNTLGVIYKKHGDMAQAEQVLKDVLAREPRSTSAMQNLALVYNDEGREAEADAMSERLERIESRPPFHYFNLGREAMAAGDYRKARQMFLREVERDPYYHEFHYWLAAACLRLGEGDCARRELLAAVENSPTRSDRDIYSAKLHRLKAR
jgi:tetratricopeptide (TPR) repeat protein